MANIIVIPARMGSKRLRDKPILPINGIPMVVRVAQQAAKSKRAHSVIVATDHGGIAEAVCAERYPKLVSAAMTNTECRTGTDRIASLTDSVINRGDIVVNMQGDLPFVDPRIADELFVFMEDNIHVHMATACNLRLLPKHLDMYNSYNSVKVVIDSRQNACLFSRSPIPHNAAEAGFFYHHFGMYAYRTPVLEFYKTMPTTPLERAEKLEQLRALESGVKIKVLVTEYEAGQEVNTHEDWERAQELAYVN